MLQHITSFGSFVWLALIIFAIGRSMVFVNHAQGSHAQCVCKARTLDFIASPGSVFTIHVIRLISKGGTCSIFLLSFV